MPIRNDNEMDDRGVVSLVSFLLLFDVYRHRVRSEGPPQPQTLAVSLLHGEIRLRSNESHQLWDLREGVANNM